MGVGGTSWVILLANFALGIVVGRFVFKFLAGGGFPRWAKVTAASILGIAVALTHYVRVWISNTSMRSSRE
jgi:hypothetical protein